MHFELERVVAAPVHSNADPGVRRTVLKSVADEVRENLQEAVDIP
jgi:hypothetical protein